MARFNVARVWLYAGLLALISEPALAQDDAGAGGLEDLEAIEALEAEMLEDLVLSRPSGRDVAGPYEALEPLSGSPGLRTVVDVPRAERWAVTDGSGHVGDSPLAPDAPAELPPAPMAPALEHFDLTDIEPLFGLESLNHEPIRNYLEFFTGRGRRRLARLLSRSGRYADLIRTALREAGLPEELLYLVMIESGFDPVAESHAGAVGLWQFMAPTGRSYGLEIGRRYDERRDPEASTRAAIDYLASLHERFGSWPLAMAGYNAGGGHVRGELRRYNLNDFWRMDDYSCVYDDTRRYVYKIIAAAIIGEHPARFGFEGVVIEEPARFDVVEVPGETRLQVFARACESDVETLLTLNPALRVASTPDVESYELRIPAGSIEAFLAAYDRYVVGEEGAAYVHNVRVGETVESLSSVFGLPERVLRAANGLGRHEEPAYGRDVVVPLHPDDAERLLADQPGPPPDEDDRLVVITPPLVFDYPDRDRRFYEVQPRDQLPVVARAFGVTVWDLAMWNDIDPDAVLHGGMTLQVFVEPGADLSGVRSLPEEHVRALALGSPDYVAWDEAQERRRRASRRTYTIRRGDNLGSIARRFGVSTNDLMRWNGIDDPHRIRSGQTLRVR